ncbi:MAG TPA: dihydroneopterin aldolase [Candidatus Limnocylindrales bacterium]|nr:dihydroneopterin aldolase [Candidatus Limnocylindrales bacterium]
MAIHLRGCTRRALRVAGKLRHARSVDGSISGWVSIRGLHCLARQGVTDEQREHESEYLVDIAVRTDLRAAVEHDDLAKALDIAALADVVRAEMARRPRALVERMTADVARAVLEGFPAVLEARARVEKQHPDGLGADAESVEISLTRP